MAETELNKEIAIFITQLTAAIQNTGMYPDDHPKVASTIQEAFDQLEGLLKAKQNITIIMIGENILVDNKPLIIPSTYKTAFLRALNKMSLERTTIRNGLPFSEFAEFIRSISSSSISPLHTTPYIILGKLELKNRPEEPPEEDVATEPLMQDVEKIHDIWSQSPEHTLEEIYQNIVQKKKLDFEMVDGIVVQFINSIPRETNPLRLLSHIKSTDEYTFVHTVNVGILTMSLAQYLGFRGHDFYKICVAAVLHDFGKITIPHDILSKHGALTPEERHIIENHTISGAMHLLELKNISNLAVLAAMEHHIKYDGTGYPHVQCPWSTNIVSQMITVADVFDALRTKRPYRDPMAQSEITQIMKGESGTTFNPYLIERFFALIEQP